MRQRVISLILALSLILLLSPSAIADSPSIPERKGMAPSEGDWLDPQFDAAPDAYENPPLTVQTVRIGLSFGDSAVSHAAFRDVGDAGFRIGYYDDSRVFQELSRTNCAFVTVEPSWFDDSGLMLVDGESLELLYRSPNSRLALEPLSGESWYGENRYLGGFECLRLPDDRMTVVSVLDLESYVKGVVPYEMAGDWPAEALKAQAVCARTYVVYNLNAYADQGFDITDDTECQVYRGLGKAEAATDAAVDATLDQVLRYRGEICQIYYFAADGGYTEDGALIFDADRPYLSGKRDPFESVEDYAFRQWTLRFSGETIAYRLGLKGYDMDTIVSVFPEYSEFGNVIALRFVSEQGRELRLAGRDCCAPLRLYSHRFSVKATPDGEFIFSGTGLGHNCGMSQWGARAMDEIYGYTYRQILAFYYTGAYVA